MRASAGRFSPTRSYEAVLDAVKAAKIPTVMSEVTMVASTYTKLEGSPANQMIRLLDALEDLDDTRMSTRTSTWTRRRWKRRRGNGREPKQGLRQGLRGLQAAFVAAFSCEEAGCETRNRDPGGYAVRKGIQFVSTCNRIVAMVLVVGLATAARSEMPATSGVAAGGNTLATSLSSQISGKWEHGAVRAIGDRASGDRSPILFFLGRIRRSGSVLTPVIQAGIAERALRSWGRCHAALAGLYSGGAHPDDYVLTNGDR